MGGGSSDPGPSLNPPDGYRLLQVFISAKGRGLFHVSYNPNPKPALWCDCFGFGRRRRCKHVEYVRTVVRMNSGAYPMELQLEEDLDSSQLAEMAKEMTVDEWRMWLIEHGKVVVL